jgi:hypothetical protein
LVQAVMDLSSDVISNQPPQYVFYCRPDLIYKKYGLAHVIWSRDRVTDNYPMAENLKGHLFWDTISIQNLIWSICLGILVARWLRFRARHN